MSCSWRGKVGKLLRGAGSALLCALALAPAAAVAAPSATSTASAQVVAGRLGRAAPVREYWTAARMRAAEPAWLEPGPARFVGPAAARPDAAPSSVASQRAAAVDSSAEPTAFPQRVHGKVFFTIAGGSQPGDYVCSGTVVASNSHALAWTAGHCVNDAEFGGGFATNWIFVPAYRNGERPFGTWPASTLFTTRGWKQNVNTRLDLGAAELARDAQGRGLQDLIGARGIAFNQDLALNVTAFGYPAQPTLLHPDFDGERLYACASPITGTDDPPGSGPETMQIECDMSGGSSGGSWVSNSGRVNSVTSYGYASDLFHLYGPYQGSVAEELYEEASGPRITCGGFAVTNLGGPAPDAFSGGDGDDVFKLRGADDSAAGGAGEDVACGAQGADSLAGEDGDDLLRGGPGRDLLLGGPGRDTCVGGPGRERARGCEVRRQIP